MKSLTCYLDPYSSKHMIKDNFSNEEYWISYDELCIYLHGLCREKGYQKIFLKGSYSDSMDLIWKFENLYKNSDISIITE